MIAPQPRTLSAVNHILHEGCPVNAFSALRQWRRSIRASTQRVQAGQLLTRRGAQGHHRAQHRGGGARAARHAGGAGRGRGALPRGLRVRRAEAGCARAWLGSLRGRPSFTCAPVNRTVIGITSSICWPCNVHAHGHELQGSAGEKTPADTTITPPPKVHWKILHARLTWDLASCSDDAGGGRQLLWARGGRQRRGTAARGAARALSRLQPRPAAVPA